VSGFNKPPALADTNFFPVAIPCVNLITPWSSSYYFSPLLGG
jgi:hypothetical protein